MASETSSHGDSRNHDLPLDMEDEYPKMTNGIIHRGSRQSSPSKSKTPEPKLEQQPLRDDTPGTPVQLPPFDWDDFQVRYEQALQDLEEDEAAILKDAEQLSGYFKVWASAASAHDDERAVKRLQTRQRFVNLSEERMEQKQRHYNEVVRAFESALALLKST